MPRIILSLILLVSGFTTLQAQAGSGSIKGKINDEQGLPLPLATVMLRSTTDSALVKAGLTDDKGVFAFVQIPEGNYWIESRFTGYTSDSAESFSLNAGQTLELPVYSMSSVGATMETVNIVEEKPLIMVKPDMTVFNVEGTVNAVGENAFNLLRKAPGVIIDNSDNLMLMGKNGVRVYIDGKPSPLSGNDLALFLKSIQSDQIESFEIITSPSSKFDAAGNAGIINIRFKRDKNLGTNATVNADYSAWINHRVNGSVAVNYRNKNMALFGSYGAATGKSRNWMHFVREQVGIGYDQQTVVVDNYFRQNFRMGGDFFIGKNHTLGFVTTGFLANSGMDSEAMNVISDAQADTVTGLLQSNGNNDSKRNNLNFNLNYRFDNKKSTKVSLDADYGTYSLNTSSFQPNLYLDPVTQAVLLDRSFTSEAPSRIDIYTFKADFEKPLLKGQFAAGLKYANVRTNNVFDFYDLVDGEEIMDSTRSNEFDYTENVNAAYVNYTRKFKKWGFQAGLRGEQTNSVGDLTAFVDTDNERVERHYFNLFPSGGVTWDPNMKNSLRLTYGRRIDRPNYETLNPFQMKLDELSYMVGNPFLKPQYTHNFELSHTYQYTLTTSLSYSITNDFFTEITDTIEQVRTFLTTQNLSTQKVMTLSVSYPREITKWWSTYTNASVFNMRNQADFGPGKEINIAATSFSIFHQSSFKVRKSLEMQLSGFYNSPGLWGANFRNQKFWGIEIGAVQKLFKDRGLLKVGLSDVLYTMKWRGIQEFGALYFDASGGWESRQIKVSYSHTFGNTAVKNRKRSTGLEEESKRAGSGGGGPGR